MTESNRIHFRYFLNFIIKNPPKRADPRWSSQCPQITHFILNVNNKYTHECHTILVRPTKMCLCARVSMCMIVCCLPKRAHTQTSKQFQLNAFRLHIRCFDWCGFVGVPFQMARCGPFCKHSAVINNNYCNDVIWYTCIGIASHRGSSRRV